MNVAKPKVSSCEGLSLLAVRLLGLYLFLNGESLRQVGELHNQ